MSTTIDSFTTRGEYTSRQVPCTSAAALIELGFSAEDVHDAWEPTFDRLYTIRSYKDDWDGDGSAAPGVALVDNAIKHAADLRHKKHCPPDRVVATVNGTVCFEWYQDNGLIELEVFAPNLAQLRRTQCGRPIPAFTVSHTR